MYLEMNYYQKNSIRSQSRRGILIGLLALVVLATPCRLEAQSILLVTGEAPPLTGKNLPGYGVVTKVVVNAFERAGFAPTVQMVPWKRAELMVQRGQAVATFPYYKTNERQKTYIYSRNPVFVFDLHLIVASENVGKWRSFSDLTSHTMCYPLGWAIPFENEEFEAMLGSGAILHSEPLNMSDCLLQIARGRADFTWLGPWQAGQTAQEALADPESVQADPGFVAGTTGMYAIASRADPNSRSYLEQFDRALESMKSDGTYQSIIESGL